MFFWVFCFNHLKSTFLSRGLLDEVSPVSPKINLSYLSDVMLQRRLLYYRFNPTGSALRSCNAHLQPRRTRCQQIAASES